MKPFCIVISDVPNDPEALDRFLLKVLPIYSTIEPKGIRKPKRNTGPRDRWGNMK